MNHRPPSNTKICYFILFAMILPFTLISQKSRKQPNNVIANSNVSKHPIDINDYFKPLKWRSIGPFRGGRSVATSGVRGDIHTYYMGTTGGGLWKTDDMGLNWKNISDGFFKTGSVGAIAVSESDPNIIYVGMGEHAVRGVKTHHGDGMYKSTDAGKTWKKIGLEKTQHISRVVIHPKNPDIVYVAAQGALYGPSQDRGIYKSIDGGTTWKNVLYTDEKTGCVELSMDMNNPLILYAAMWEHGRLPWKVISGGPGSGLYKSVDGGNSWNKIHEGLPAELGKMAIAVSRSNSDKVYALIESDSEKGQGGLFVSENGGKSWSRISADNRLIQRAWYYIEVFVDPKDENTVYVLSAPALRSIDGGKSWEIINGPHGDYHDLWINPDNSKNMIIADDGGASVSFNFCKTWSLQNNMPTAQLYRINVDNQFPYRIYAGQQDNTSLVISSRELASGGITSASWSASAGGESAFLAFNPDDPRYVLGGSYLGTIEVLDTKAKAGTNIMAAPIQYLARETKDMKYRFNWNAPIIWSKHEPDTYYHGAQYLLRTRDMGKTWEEASPDLTKNEKEKQGKGGGPFTNEAVGAENYGTISYITESPNEKGTILVASDDGLLHITRDGCKNWQNITPAGLKECLINAIEVSPHDPATIYIATTRYKFNDHTPGLYKSTDYGKNWISINQGIASDAFTRVVREDDVIRHLLYAGTESGTYISWDGGANWTSFQLNLPITPVTDLKVHQGNLIAATSGRSFWILDDLSLIRQFKKDTTNFEFFKPSPAILVNGYSEMDSNDPNFNGSNPVNGVNPATGAVLYYFLPDTKSDAPLELDIMDSNGRLVRRFSSVKDSLFQQYDGGPPSEPTLSKSKGLNRFVWNLRHHTMPGVPDVYIESSYRGHKSIPGTYYLHLKHGEISKKVTIEIQPNPLYSTSQETYRVYDQIMTEMEKEVSLMHNLVNSIYKKKQQLEKLMSGWDNSEKYSKLKVSAQNLLNKMKKWDEAMVQRKSKAYDDVENFPNKFTANYMFMMNHNESDQPRTNQPTLDRKAELEKEWVLLKAIAYEIIDTDVPSYNKELWNAGIGGIWE
jgi:photosystem II stability/assembly factor-like uncharacterized protein